MNGTNPRRLMTHKCRQLMLKVWQMRKAQQMTSPQAVALAMGYDISARIADELKILETIGYLKRVRHSHHHVEIVPLKEAFEF